MNNFYTKPVSHIVRSNALILIQAKLHTRQFATTAINKIEKSAKREEALKKYDLYNLHLDWPKAAKQSENVDYQRRNPRSIRQMYGNADLSKLPIFQGGFINFGYWPNKTLEQEDITVEQRIASSQEMYRVIGNLCGVLKDHNILDVGSGLGYGSAFISEQYAPKLVVGVDISPDQIARAKKHQVSGITSGRLRFTIGEAESMPFTDCSFDTIVSVEAAQHFSHMGDFAKEISRVVKPGGKLIVTSFFPTSQEGIEALNAIVPDYHVMGSQYTIDEVKKEFSKYMERVRVKSIGQNVWYGFSKWLDQIGYHSQWSKIWCALYEKGLIDYVIYEAEAPLRSNRPQQENFSTCFLRR